MKAGTTTLRELVPVGDLEHIEVLASDADLMRLVYVRLPNSADAKVMRDFVTVTLTADEAERLAVAINRTIAEAKRRFPKAAEDTER